GEEIGRAQRRQLTLERRPVWPHARRDARPVVEAGAPDLLVRERESQRPDQMQLRARRQTGAARVARVPVDLRLDEDDVQRHGSTRYAARARSRGKTMSPKRSRQRPSTWLPSSAKMRRTSW